MGEGVLTHGHRPMLVCGTWGWGQGVCTHVWPHVPISTNSAHSQGSRLLDCDFENTSHPSLCVFLLRNVSTPPLSHSS